MNLQKLVELNIWRYELTARLLLTLMHQSELQDRELMEFSLVELAGLMWTFGPRGLPNVPAKSTVSDAVMRLEAAGLIRTGVGTQGRTTFELTNGMKLLTNSTAKKVKPDAPMVAKPDGPTLPKAEVMLPWPSPEFEAAWAAFCAHRRSIRYPLTPRAVELAFKQCRAWGEERAIQALNASVMNGWRGLFEPKGNGGNFDAAKTKIAARQRRLEEEEQ